MISAISNRKPKSKPSQRRTMLMLMVPFVAIIMFMVATADDGGPVRAARERWNDKGFDSYEMTYSYNGLGPATVVVDDGVISAYRTDDPRLEDARIYVVETLFDALANATASQRGEIAEVEFDPDTGHPLSGLIDPDTERDGDEVSFEVTELSAR